MKTVTCEYCDKSMPDDPGSYYHRSACEANYVLGLLKNPNLDASERKKLNYRLEMARYVGD